MNKFEFDEVKFLEIIDGLTYVLQGLSDDDTQSVNIVLNKILDKYAIKDYYYIIELFEYEFLPLFSEEK